MVSVHQKFVTDCVCDMLAAGFNCSRSQNSAWGSSCSREACDLFPFGEALHQKALSNDLVKVSILTREHSSLNEAFMAYLILVTSQVAII